MEGGSTLAKREELFVLEKFEGTPVARRE